MADRSAMHKGAPKRGQGRTGEGIIQEFTDHRAAAEYHHELVNTFGRDATLHIDETTGVARVVEHMRAGHVDVYEGEKRGWKRRKIDRDQYKQQSIGIHSALMEDKRYYDHVAVTGKVTNQTPEGRDMLKGMGLDHRRYTGSNPIGDASHVPGRHGGTPTPLHSVGNFEKDSSAADYKVAAADARRNPLHAFQDAVEDASHALGKNASAIDAHTMALDGSTKSLNESSPHISGDVLQAIIQANNAGPVTGTAAIHADDPLQQGIIGNLAAAAIPGMAGGRGAGAGEPSVAFRSANGQPPIDPAQIAKPGLGFMGNRQRNLESVNHQWYQVFAMSENAQRAGQVTDVNMAAAKQYMDARSDAMFRTGLTSGALTNDTTKHDYEAGSKVMNQLFAVTSNGALSGSNVGSLFTGSAIAGIDRVALNNSDVNLTGSALETLSSAGRIVNEALSPVTDPMEEFGKDAYDSVPWLGDAERGPEDRIPMTRMSMNDLGLTMGYSGDQQAQMFAGYAAGSGLKLDGAAMSNVLENQDFVRSISDLEQSVRDGTATQQDLEKAMSEATGAQKEALATYRTLQDAQYASLMIGDVGAKFGMDPAQYATGLGRAIRGEMNRSGGEVDSTGRAVDMDRRMLAESDFVVGAVQKYGVNAQEFMQQMQVIRGVVAPKVNMNVRATQQMMGADGEMTNVDAGLSENESAAKVLGNIVAAATSEDVIDPMGMVQNLANMGFRPTGAQGIAMLRNRTLTDGAPMISDDWKFTEAAGPLTGGKVVTDEQGRARYVDAQGNAANLPINSSETVGLMQAQESQRASISAQTYGYQQSAYLLGYGSMASADMMGSLGSKVGTEEDPGLGARTGPSYDFGKGITLNGQFALEARGIDIKAEQVELEGEIMQKSAPFQKRGLELQMQQNEMGATQGLRRAQFAVDLLPLEEKVMKFQQMIARNQLDRQQQSITANRAYEDFLYGKPGTDRSYSGYLSAKSDAMARQQSGTSAGSATRDIVNVVGLEAAQTYAGLDYQQQMLALGQSGLNAGASYATQMGYIQQQREFYELGADAKGDLRETSRRLEDEALAEQIELLPMVQELETARFEEQKRQAYENLAMAKLQYEAMLNNNALLQIELDYFDEKLDLQLRQNQLTQDELDFQRELIPLKQKAAEEELKHTQELIKYAEMLADIQLLESMGAGAFVASQQMIDKGLVDDKGAIEFDKLWTMINNDTRDASVVAGEFGMTEDQIDFIRNHTLDEFTDVAAGGTENLAGGELLDKQAQIVNQFEAGARQMHIAAVMNMSASKLFNTASIKLAEEARQGSLFSSGISALAMAGGIGSGLYLGSKFATSVIGRGQRSQTVRDGYQSLRGRFSRGGAQQGPPAPKTPPVPGGRAMGAMGGVPPAARGGMRGVMGRGMGAMGRGMRGFGGAVGGMGRNFMTGLMGPSGGAAAAGGPVWDGKSGRWRDAQTGRFAQPPAGMAGPPPGAPVWDSKNNRWRDPQTGRYTAAPKAPITGPASAAPTTRMGRAGQSVGSAGRAIGRGMGTAGRAVGRGAGAVGRGIGRGAGAVGRGIGRGYGRMGGGMGMMGAIGMGMMGAELGGDFGAQIGGMFGKDEKSRARNAKVGGVMGTIGGAAAMGAMVGGPVGALVGAGVGVLMALHKNGGILNNLGKAFGWLGEQFKHPIKMLKDVGGFLKDMGKTAGNWLKDAGSWILDIGKKMVQWVASVDWAEVGKQILVAIVQAVQAVGSFLLGIPAKLGEVVTGIVDWVREKFDAPDWLQKPLDILLGIVGAPFKSIIDIFNGIKADLDAGNWLQVIIGVLTAPFQHLWNTMTNIYDTLMENETIAGILDKVLAPFRWIGDTVGGWFDSISKNETFQTVMEKVQGVIDWFGGIFDDPIGKLKELGGLLFGTEDQMDEATGSRVIKEGTVGLFEKPFELIKGFFQPIIEKFESGDYFGGILDLFFTPFDLIQKGLETIRDAVGGLGWEDTVVIDQLTGEETVVQVEKDGFVASMARAVYGVLDWVTEKFATVKEWLKGKYEGIGDIIANPIETIKGWFENITGLFGGDEEETLLAENQMDRGYQPKTEGLLDQVWGYIKKPFDLIMEYFGGIVEKFQEGDYLGGIQDIIFAPLRLIEEAFGTIRDKIGGLGWDTQTYIDEFGQEYEIKTEKDGLIAKMARSVYGPINWVAENFGKIEEMLGTYYSTLWEAVSNPIETFKGLFNSVSDWLMGYDEKVYTEDVGTNLDEYTIVKHEGVLSDIWGRITGVFETIAGWFEGIGTWIEENIDLKGIFVGIANKLIDIVNGAIDWINKLPFVDIGHIGKIGVTYENGMVAETDNTGIVNNNVADEGDADATRKAAEEAAAQYANLVLSTERLATNSEKQVLLLQGILQVLSGVHGIVGNDSIRPDPADQTKMIWDERIQVELNSIVGEGGLIQLSALGGVSSIKLENFENGGTTYNQLFSIWSTLEQILDNTRGLGKAFGQGESSDTDSMTGGGDSPMLMLLKALTATFADGGVTNGQLYSLWKALGGDLSVTPLGSIASGVSVLANKMNDLNTALGANGVLAASLNETGDIYLGLTGIMGSLGPSGVIGVAVAGMTERINLLPTNAQLITALTPHRNTLVEMRDLLKKINDKSTTVNVTGSSNGTSEGYLRMIAANTGSSLVYDEKMFEQLNRLISKAIRTVDAPVTIGSDREVMQAQIPGLHSGGTTGQAGARMYLVGERGPELVILPAGATVLPDSRTTLELNKLVNYATMDRSTIVDMLSKATPYHAAEGTGGASITSGCTRRRLDLGWVMQNGKRCNKVAIYKKCTGDAYERYETTEYANCYTPTSENNSSNNTTPTAMEGAFENCSTWKQSSGRKTENGYSCELVHTFRKCTLYGTTTTKITKTEKSNCYSVQNQPNPSGYDTTAGTNVGTGAGTGSGTGAGTGSGTGGDYTGDTGAGTGTDSGFSSDAIDLLKEIRDEIKKLREFLMGVSSQGVSGNAPATDDASRLPQGDSYAVPGAATGIGGFMDSSTHDLMLVGERGPELVFLPKGAGVYPDSRTAGVIRALEAGEGESNYDAVERFKHLARNGFAATGKGYTPDLGYALRQDQLVGASRANLENVPAQGPVDAGRAIEERLIGLTPTTARNITMSSTSSANKTVNVTVNLNGNSAVSPEMIARLKAEVAAEIRKVLEED